MKKKRLVAFSDMHQGNVVILPKNISILTPQKLLENLFNREPDAILIAGDLQDYMWNLGSSEEKSGLVKEKLLEDPVLKALNESNIPIYFVWGNTDIMDVENRSEDCVNTPITDNIRKWFEKEFDNFNNIHGKLEYIDGEMPIIGYGDANKTSDEHSGKCWEEPSIVKDIKPLLAKLEGKERKNVIFLTHTPPRGILDFSSVGDKHIGSYFLREIIENFQPLLSMFGHVHYCGGYSSYIGRTQCLNVSSFGLAVSYDILFGQSAFEIYIDEKGSIEKTSMIVSHYWLGQRKKNFVDYRKCQVCGRYAPFARSQFKVCRICLSSRRLENKLRVTNR
ncbi:MAG: metallophosphoesterase [Candidatus Hodarchaeales archaeon]